MASNRSVVLDAQGMARAIGLMAEAIVQQNGGTDDLVLVGIQRRGVHVAHRIAAAIAGTHSAQVVRGALDITLYRDDLQTVGPRPIVGRTEIPVAIDGMNVVIVDDVLFTGRTIRAALNELADFGRAARIGLAVLIDRGGRELPIQPDVVGLHVEAAKSARVDVMVAECDRRDEVLLDEGSGA